jgi:hypothetical protein
LSPFYFIPPFLSLTAPFLISLFLFYPCTHSSVRISATLQIESQSYLSTINAKLHKYGGGGTGTSQI